MNAVERVKSICKQRKIPISKLETDLGYGNAYISGLKKGVFPNDRLEEIANYLNLPSYYLSTGEEKAPSELPDQSGLWKKIRHDEALLSALEKYMKLSDKKKKHVLDTIDVLSEA